MKTFDGCVKSKNFDFRRCSLKIFKTLKRLMSESTGALFTCNWLARKLRNILDFYMHPFSKEPSIRVGIKLSQYVPSKDARSMSLTFSTSAFWLLHPFPVEAAYMTSLSSSICSYQDAKHQEPLRVLSFYKSAMHCTIIFSVCKVSKLRYILRMYCDINFLFPRVSYQFKNTHGFFKVCPPQRICPNAKVSSTMPFYAMELKRQWHQTTQLVAES